MTSEPEVEQGYIGYGQCDVCGAPNYLFPLEEGADADYGVIVRTILVGKYGFNICLRCYSKPNIRQEFLTTIRELAKSYEEREKGNVS